LKIEIVHRRSPSGDAEQISIPLQAMPSFEAFGRFLEDANPFAFWVQASRLAWLPWLEAARIALLPFSYALAAESRLGRAAVALGGCGIAAALGPLRRTEKAERSSASPPSPREAGRGWRAPKARAG
jgi:hypothetical protein